MATKKTTSKTKKPLDQDSIISMYMDYVLENEKTPKVVYKFCKDHKIKEEEFYNYFGSFQALEKAIWLRFYDHTVEVMHRSEDYVSFSNREKLLTFYYTFFEVLTANRSYVLFTLQKENSPLKNLEQLKLLRKGIKTFATGLIQEGNADTKLKLFKQSETIFSEATWIQLLFLLKFWMNDNSPRFESTDVAIEKSVHTVFDVFDNTPLERIVDFGKFLWKEKMS